MLALLTAALQAFAMTRDRPTLIIVQSHIGYGAPHKQDSAQAHGEPLGAEEVRAAKVFYGCDPDAQFAVPEAVPGHFAQQFGLRGARAHATPLGATPRSPAIAGRCRRRWAVGWVGGEGVRADCSVQPG